MIVNAETREVGARKVKRVRLEIDMALGEAERFRRVCVLVKTSTFDGFIGRAFELLEDKLSECIEGSKG